MADTDFRERARRRAAERQVSVWYKLKEGDNTFRVLRTPEGKTTPSVFFEYAMHRDVGPKKTQVRCGKDPETGKGKCWLCDSQIPKLRDKGHEGRAAALEARNVALVQVASVSEDGTMTGPFLFTPSTTVANQILTSVLGSKKRDYTDPKKGYNLTINRTGTGRNDTRYGLIEPDTDPSQVPAELVKRVKPFDELKEVPPYSESKQRAAYTGSDVVEEEDDDEDDTVVVEEEEDEDEEEEAPPVKSKKSAPTKKAAPVVEVEDEDDEEEADEEDDDEEDEDEPPAKPAKKAPPAKGKKAAPVVEEEEDDEEAEEDDEEEADEEDDDEEVDLDDLDDDDEEDEPPAKPAKKPEPPAKRPVPPKKKGR